MRNENNTLLMGIGNYLMGDEGVGVHLVQRWLSEDQGIASVDVVDGGTGGFHLLEYFESYNRVILVDATLDGEPPGTVRSIRPRFSADFPAAMSTHDIGLKDLVGALQLLGKMPEIILFVVSIDSVQQQGTTLTPAIERVMPELRDEIRRLLAE